MADRLTAIQRALDEFRMDEARSLAADELAEKPSASAYYLASLAARNHGQRVEYLHKTLELDPEHARAAEELRDVTPPKPGERAADARAEPAIRFAACTRRFYALMVDAGIITVLSLLFLLAKDAFAPLQEALYSADKAAAADAFRRFQAVTIVVNLAVSCVYHLAFMTIFNGRTPGKLWLRMRVVKINGQRITPMDALLRNVFGYAVSQLFLLGFIWAVVDDDVQAWHDKMARTIVIDERPAPDDESPED